MGNGAVRAGIVYLTAGVNGNGASRTVTLTIAGASCTLIVAAGGTAPALQGRDCAMALVNGGTGRFTITPNGSMHFSHGGTGGPSFDGYGTSYSGSVYCGYTYVLPPNAPTIGTVSSTALGTATVAFTGATDDGGSAISTHRIEYSTDSFATIAGYVEATSGPVTITGLTPGVVYYFRVAARNAVTDAAGTVGAYSSVSSVTILGGVKVGKSGAWVTCAVYAGVNGAWVPVQVFAGRAGAWVGLTT